MSEDQAVLDAYHDALDRMTSVVAERVGEIMGLVHRYAEASRTGADDAQRQRMVLLTRIVALAYIDSEMSI